MIGALGRLGVIIRGLRMNRWGDTDHIVVVHRAPGVSLDTGRPLLRLRKGVLCASTKEGSSTIHAGFIETDINVPRVSPAAVATAMIEAILAGREEVLADKTSHEIKAALATDPKAFYWRIQEIWDSKH